MPDVTTLGNNVAGLNAAVDFGAISKVILKVSEETSYTAGNNTGRTITVECPWGTQTMANNILTQLSGFAYKPYTADSALLNPAVEIGDGVYIHGFYSGVYSQENHFIRLFNANISAPGDQEIDHEYPFTSPVEREVAKAVAPIADEVSTLSSTVDDISDDVDDIDNLTSGWRYGGTTQIDGSRIMAGTVQASELLGGMVGLLNANEQQVGSLTITGASTSTFKIDLSSEGALSIEAERGNVNISSNNGGVIELGSNVAVNGSSLNPADDGYMSCGASWARWSVVYAASSAISTSDRAKKHSISYDVDEYSSLFDKLKPVSYKFDDGTSDRTHTGLIAQDVETALAECGIDSKDFAGFIKSHKVNEKGETVEGFDYALRYEEFISLCIAEIQKLKSRVSELEQRGELNG